MGTAITLYSGDHDDDLIPVEFDRRNGATRQEGWPTLLVRGGYITSEFSPTFYALPLSPSVFRCPSGLPEVYTLPPASRDDPEGARAWPFASDGKVGTSYIHCWYGINGTASRTRKWPCTRIPMDLTGSTSANKLTRAGLSPRMPLLYDGWWMHNGKDERINARHSKNTRSNLLFFDLSARTFDTFQLPGVNEKSDGEVCWRFEK